MDVADFVIASIVHLSGRELIDRVPAGPVVELGQFESEAGFDPPSATLAGITNSRDCQGYVTLPAMAGGFFGPRGSEMTYVVSYHGNGSGVAAVAGR